MEKPLVSVILTTYNRPEYLQRAVDSILCQSFREFELIIVDDCSDTPINPILPEGEDRVSIIRFPWHTGFHVRPKNAGIVMARGDYIAYLEDDNVYLPNHLQVLYDVITKTAADVVYGDRIYKSTIPNESRFMGKMSQDFSLERLEQGNFIDTSDIMHTIGAIDEVGYWSIFWKKQPDWLLMLKFGEVGKKITHVPIVITEYHWHAGNYSSSHNMLGELIG